jgi:hypothetical protein
MNLRESIKIDILPYKGLNKWEYFSTAAEV